MSISGSERLSPISVQDYLDGEAKARRKHEYVAGRIYAMVGGRFAHNLIASNVLIEIGSQLKGTPCRALNSDSKVKVQTAAQTLFYYPDVSVVCGDNIRDGVFQDQPAIVVEVLSKSTRRADEGEKLKSYLSLDSLAVYLLVEQEFAAVTVHRRTSSGFERSVVQGLDASLELPEIGVRLPLQSIYAGVTFQPEPDPAE
ncbi:MAG: Uma2 family endonuclease [Planctomycetaceae bacterium]